MSKKNKTTKTTTIKEVSGQNAQAPLVINGQFVKNLSFDNPSPFPKQEETGQPSMTVNIEAKAHNVSDRIFEVTLHTQVEAKRKDDQVFMLDLVYAGVFTIGNEVAAENIRPILMIECPRILFPFARNIVATTSQEGGYPPVLLTPVDFVGLYQSQIAQEKAQQATVQ